jgi:acyl dehydratase
MMSSGCEPRPSLSGSLKRVPETSAVRFDLAAIGRAGSGYPYEVTEAATQAYAEATDDVAVGPVFAVVPVWNAIAPASEAVASGDVRRFVVHYEQDMLLHRPLEAGMCVVSRATPVAVLPRPNGTSLVIKTETRDEDGELVNEQYVTEFFRGVQADEGVGERAPDHRLEADGDPVAEVTYLVAEDQTARYAAASGDDFAIHLDDEFARVVGLPGRIVHGLCTMAFAGRAVLEAAAIEDPRAVKRIAVRFSAPLFPGETVRTRVWNVDGAFGFESVGPQGTAVLKDGRLELR